MIWGINWYGVRTIPCRVKAKLTYKAISYLVVDWDIRWWTNNISNQNIQNKIKIFVWLVQQNKIISQQNSQKKGIACPDQCCLCRNEGEYVDHIFIGCQFTKNIWNLVLKVMGIREQLAHTSFVEFLQYWWENFKIVFFSYLLLGNLVSIQSCQSH